MSHFLGKSTWSFSSVMAKVISGIFINKIFAMQFGTTGITLLAHFQNLIGLVTQIPNDGVNRGIIRYWSGKSMNNTEKNQLLMTAFWLNLILFIISICGILLFHDYIFKFFNSKLTAGASGWIMAAAILAYILNLFLLSVILSFQYIRQYAILNIIGAAITMFAVFAGIKSHNLNIALLSFLSGVAANFVFTGYYVARYRLIKPVSAAISGDSVKKLGEFILMAVSVLACGKFVEFYVRSLAIGDFGMRLTGLWQAVAKMSDGYTMVFINTVGVVYYPQISSLILDPDQLRTYLKDVFRIVTVITMIGLFLVFFFRYPLLTLLYNQSFKAAAGLMPLQLIGDFFCILSYLLTYIISAQARTTTFIILQATSAFFYILLIHLMIPYLHIMAFPSAHAVRYVLYFIILITLNRRILF